MRFAKSPLDELLDARFNDTSDRDLERKGIIARQTLRRIRNGQRPSPVTIASLARSLAVPERLIVEIVEATIERAATR
jgi:transcriptional regulator with XRE-family HTH domain